MRQWRRNGQAQVMADGSRGVEAAARADFVCLWLSVNNKGGVCYVE